jgi:serine protease Do
VSALLAPEPTLHLARIADRLQQVTVEISGAGGGGAGILWAPDLVVTNAHVARTSRVRVGLADDRQIEASLIAADRRADLALLRVPRVEIAPADSTDSDALRVGALVVAVGHPFGLRRTLTAGVVHGFPLSRSGGRWIQADLRLAPGNSGGPLADTTGRVVGINTMIAGGLALAIPVNDVRRFVAACATGVP